MRKREKLCCFQEGYFESGIYFLVMSQLYTLKNVDGKGESITCRIWQVGECGGEPEI